MRFFAHFFFWTSLLALVARIIYISDGAYPRKKEVSVATDAFDAVIYTAMACFAAYHLWLTP